MNSLTKAHLGLLGTNLFFAINYSAIKYFTANHYAGPFGINIIRIGVSLVLFWSVIFIQTSKNKIEKKDIPAFLLCALTAIALNQMLFIKGLVFYFSNSCISAHVITPIMITIIAARILKEKLTLAKSDRPVAWSVAGAIITDCQTEK